MGYRDEKHCIEGFNLLVLDIDKGTTVQTAQNLLSEYTWHMYTTKRHTSESHRFRIIMPTSHIMKLDENEYKDFMANVSTWLPFECDLQTFQRSRKWLSHKGECWTNQGILINVLPFIPKTSKNEAHKKFIVTYETLSNLQRWFLQRMLTGTRNNNMLKFALLLADSKLPLDKIQDQVTELNSKLPEPLPEREINSTVMVTVAKHLSKK